MSEMPDRVRVAFTLKRSDYEEIKRMAEVESRTVSGYVRHAAALYRWFRQAQADGRKVYVGDINGKLSEVTFL